MTQDDSQLAGTEGMPLETAEKQAPKRVPIVAEILAYLGCAFATAAVIALVAIYWEDIGVAGQLALTGLLAASTLAGGFLVGRVPEKGAQRIKQFLLFVSVGAIAGFVGIATFHAVDPMIPDDYYLRVPEGRVVYGPTEWALLAGFVTAFVSAGLLWFWNRHVLQQLVFGGAGIAVVVQTTQLIPVRTEYATGIGLAVFALVWGALAFRKWLTPVNTSLTVAALAWMTAMQALGGSASDPMSPAHSWLPYLTFGLLAAMFVLGIVVRRLPLMIVGGIGTLQMLPAIIMLLFGDRIGGLIALLLVGVALIVTAVMVGVVSARRAKRALATEAAVAIAPEEPPAQPAGVPLASEILGYLGGILSIGAIIALLVMYWDAIGVFGQVGLCAAVAVSALVGGFALGRVGDTAAKRLEQFLLAVGVVAVGGALGIAAYHATVKLGIVRIEALPSGAWTGAVEWGLFIGSLAAAIAGGVVWWVRRTPLQHIVFGCAVAASSITVLALPDVEGPDWIPGAVLVAVGVVWGVLTFLKWLTPEWTGLSLASLGILGGIEWMAVSPSFAENAALTFLPWALWLGLAVSVAMIVASIPLKRWVLLGMGAVGVVGFVPEILAQVFPNAVTGPILLLVGGVLLIIAGVAVAVFGPRIGARTPPAPPVVAA